MQLLPFSARMMRRAADVAILILLLPREVTSRSWKDVALIHSLEIPVEYMAMGRTEDDPFDYVRSPISSNNANAPVGTPTEDSRPCPGCGDYDLTSKDLYPTNEAPSNPAANYFNYDVSTDATYGPGYPSYYQYGNEFRVQYLNNGWGNVQKSDNFDYYWDEFSSNGFGAYNGVLANHNMDQSVCASGKIQSPIDIRLSGVACVETHQIRHRVSDRFFSSHGP